MEAKGHEQIDQEEEENSVVAKGHGDQTDYMDEQVVRNVQGDQTNHMDTVDLESNLRQSDQTEHKE